MKSEFVVRIVCSALIAASVSGCSVFGSKDDAGPETEAVARNIILSKVELAARAQKELDMVRVDAEAQKAAKQAAIDADVVDVDYIGPAVPLLDALAIRYAYRFNEVGKRNELKLLNISAKQNTPMDVLLTIAKQIEGDGGADLVLDKEAKAIRLVYRAPVPGVVNQ